MWEADVYSYIIICYKLITRSLLFECHQPSISDYNDVIQGKRHILSKWCPPHLANFICECWHENPHCKPSFRIIVNYLERLLDDCDLQLNRIDLLVRRACLSKVARHVVSKDIPPTIVPCGYTMGV